MRIQALLSIAALATVAATPAFAADVDAGKDISATTHKSVRQQPRKTSNHMTKAQRADMKRDVNATSKKVRDDGAMKK